MFPRSPIPKPFRTTIWWQEASPSYFCSLPISNRLQTSVRNITLVTAKRRTVRLRKFSTHKTRRARWSFRLVRTPTTYTETPRTTSYVKYHWKGVALQLFSRWNSTKGRHVFGTKGNRKCDPIEKTRNIGESPLWLHRHVAIKGFSTPLQYRSDLQMTLGRTCCAPTWDIELEAHS